MATTVHFFDHLRAHMRELKRGRPGHRFVDRYERARHEDRRGRAVKRIVLMAAAVVCLAIGLVLSVIPGPAIPFFFVAGGLLATESRLIARVMDAIEVRGRRVVAWGKVRWRRMPGWARVGAVVVVMVCSAGTAYLSYRFVKG